MDNSLFTFRTVLIIIIGMQRHSPKPLIFTLSTGRPKIDHKTWGTQVSGIPPFETDNPAVSTAVLLLKFEFRLS